MKKKLLLGLVGLFVGIQSAFATTCPSATAIPTAPTLPYTDASIVCGSTDDINFGTTSYDNGLEALYTWTPSSNYSNVTISYTGQSWVGIFVWAGCPTSGGTLVTSQTTSGTSLTTATFNLTAGVQYYIMFDTWPSPPSPCAGSFTINGTIVLPCTAPPTAGTVSAANNPICPSVNNNLSLVGATSGTGLTYQWQQSLTGAVGSYSNIAGATAATYTSNQTVDTYYRCYLTCSGQSDTTSALFVTTNSFINCYCASNATSTGDEEILNVTVGTLNNTSTCSSTGGPGSIQNQYSNYANLPATNLVRGASYPLSVQIGTCGGNYNNTTRVYVDFNQNGLFTDPGETVISPSFVNGPHTETGTLVVPVGAVLGQTRMRVVNVETTGTVNPCGTYTWGETEDYIVNIICPTLSGTGTVDQGICSGTAATFTGTPSFSGATISWWDAATGGTQLGTGNSFTTPALSSTTTYYVQEDYTGCPSSTRASIDAIVTAVAVTLVPVNVTCNGLANGSFTQTAVSCGVAPFQYSTDNGVTFGPIPTNLPAGTHYIIVQDNVGGLSAPIQVIITQPSAPTALNAYNVTFFNGMLTWTPQGNETTWNVQYGPAGFTLGSGSPMNNVTNDTVPVTGLTENTNYQFYVQAGCTTSSAWAGPFSFSTDIPFSTWDSQCGPGFIPIHTTGTALNLADDASIGITTVNPVSFQGVTSNNITVSNNGWVQFGAVTLNAWQVDLDDEDGNVYWQETTIGGDNYLIVEWYNRAKFITVAGQDVTFEIAFNQTTGEIFYLYDDKVFGGSQSAYDYAGNFATISASGPMSTLTVSYNSQTYLQNNSCVRFYTALCPNVQNMVTITYTDDAQLNWDPGMYGETNWTVIYGLDGFDPTIPGQELGTLNVNTSDVNFGGTLNQLTCYDAYIYSECQADNITSDGFLVNFCTKPNCSDITSLIGASDPDSLELTWNWAQSSPAFPVTGFNVQYGMTGFTLGSGMIVPATGINFADTIPDATLMGSGVYQVYVQAVCNVITGDTSNWVGPISIVMPVTNDIVCAQEGLQLNTTYTFNNVGATVSLNETTIAPAATGAQTTTGWVNSTLNGTLWYSFVAPPSGSVRINSTAINYNGQAAVYSATNCADFNTFTFMAANDDAIGGTSLAPNFTVCGLTPGNTYYVMYDKFNGTSGNFSLKVTEIVLEGGTANPLTSICYGDTVNLYSTITGNNTGGTWSSVIPSVNASITGGTFESNGLAYTTFDFQYRVIDGCAYDSIVSQVKVFAPSNAGQDGVITACKNEPIDLLAGLNGNADLNGDWYDPSNVLLPNSQVTTGTFPGQYNYDYISGNGVCPDDTANVVVTVTSCNWLSVDENALEEVSLYPNPSTGVLFIESGFTGNFNLVITDVNGRTVQTGKNTISTGTNTVNLKDVERGTYFFKLSSENAEKVFRVVIQ